MKKEQNNNFTYYYSREERLKRTRRIFDNEKTLNKGIDKVFAGNKTVKIFFIIYIIVLLFVYFFVYIYKNNIIRVSNLDINIKLINNKLKKGFSLEIKNNNNNFYLITNIIIKYENDILNTNTQILLDKSESDIIFIPFNINTNKFDKSKIKVIIN